MRNDQLDLFPMGRQLPNEGRPDFTYGNALHKEIKDYLRRRIDFSKKKLSGRRDAWRQSEATYRAYLDLEVVDKQRKIKEPEGTYPGFAPIIIPLPYAIVNTVITYLMSVFGGRRPIIQVDGVGPNDLKPAEAMEMVLDHQMEYARLMLRLYLWFHDCLLYGVGWMKNTWRKEFCMDVVMEPYPILGGIFRAMGREAPSRRVTKEVTKYEGNWPVVWDPYKIWPDPRVPVNQLQEGEYITFVTRKSYSSLLMDQASGLYENVEALASMRYAGTKPGSTGVESGGDSDIPREMLLQDLDDDQFVDQIDKGYPLIEETWAKIIPKDWGLGDEIKPQIWVFTVGNKEVVLRANKAGHNHNEFPVDGIEFMPDVHVALNPGLVELCAPLCEHASWLINSHMENVRKVINDVIIWDPSKLERADMLARNPGKMVRLKPTAYGTDVRTAIHQLQVMDVTQGHLKDLNVILQLIQRVTAATDNFMGLPNVGGGRTATEVRGVQQLAGGRLKTLAELISLMGFIPFTHKCVANTKQFLQGTQYYQQIARTPDMRTAIAQIQVGPEDILGNFQFPTLDGTFPFDRFALSQAWKEFFQAVTAVPTLMKLFDATEIFRQGIRALGIKNVDAFKLQPNSLQAQVMQQEELMKKVQEGNAVPVKGQGAPAQFQALQHMLGPMAGGRMNLQARGM